MVDAHSSYIESGERTAGGAGGGHRVPWFVRNCIEATACDERLRVRSMVEHPEVCAVQTCKQRTLAGSDYCMKHQDRA